MALANARFPYMSCSAPPGVWTDTCCGSKAVLKMSALALMTRPVLALSRHSHRPIGRMPPLGFLSGATLSCNHTLATAGRMARLLHIAPNCLKASTPCLVFSRALMCVFLMQLGPGSAPADSECSLRRAAASVIAVAAIFLLLATPSERRMASCAVSGVVWKSFLMLLVVSTHGATGGSPASSWTAPLTLPCAARFIAF